MYARKHPVRNLQRRKNRHQMDRPKDQRGLFWENVLTEIEKVEKEREKENKQ